MVVKTDACAFSEFRIYPGHGSKLCRRDGQVVTFATRKAKSLYLQRKKPNRLTWTIGWRRLNKKDKKEETGRTRRRKVQKGQRAPTGISIDQIKKLKKDVKKSTKGAAATAAAKEIKDRKNKKKGGK